MEQDLRWRDYLVMNFYVFGISFATGSITPLLLPYLVALFVPDAEKNTYVAVVRVASLAVAMLVQPLAGLLSDRSSHPQGRRRPYIVGATVSGLLFLAIIGASPLLQGSALDEALRPVLGVTVAYVALLVGITLLQVSSNTGQAAVQGLIPDLVPENQRGRASGVKALMELLPALPIILVAHLVGNGQVGLTVALIGVVSVMTMLGTVLGVREAALAETPPGRIRGRVLRLVALTAIFVAATRAGVGLVAYSGRWMGQLGAAVELQVAVVGLAGLLGMAGSIFVGVYLGARVGIGREAGQQAAFIWWVISRLLFLAAVGSIQTSALYYLRDVLHLPDAELWTSVLVAFVAVFLVLGALGGGYLSDRLGRKRLAGLAGLVAAAGTCLLLFANDLPLVIVAGCIVGLGAGTFMASNWALGTQLVPPEEAGRYLGISNLAGAGAGIVGAGIGGPMADFFNQLQTGLGYLVIFALYAGLFLLSALVLVRVKEGR